MKIVSSQDLGNLGPKDGAAVIYNWKWYYGVPSLTLWAVLVLVMVLVKANRNFHSLLVLVPLLIVNLLWSILKKAMSFPSTQAEMFNMLFYSLTVGIAILWLLGHKLGNRNRFVTFLHAFTIMAFVGLTGAISYSGLELSQETVRALILLAIIVFAMLLGFVLTGWWCRKRYRPVPFVLWLAVWIIAANLVILLGYAGIALVITSLLGSVPSVWISIIFQALLVGPVLGGCVYGVVLPYMILALRSSFYRQRFYACLRLKSMAATASGPAEKDTN